MTARYREGSRKGVGGRKPGPSPTKVVRLPLSVANLARRVAEGRLRAGDINAFLDINEAPPRFTVPLVASKAACGFPSPADDYLDRALDFNELLVHNPAATFAVRVAGDSMTGAGIYPGDIAIVDRSISPANGCMVLALVDGEFTLKRYRVSGDAVVLEAANPAFADIRVSAESAFEVWGVVKHAIRMF